MKKIIHIIYNLNNDDYNSNIVNLIKSTDAWMSYFKGSFLIITDYNVEHWTQLLLPYVKASDGNILVMEVKINEFNGWLPNEAWEWLKKHQSNFLLTYR